MRIAVLTPTWLPYKGGMGNVAYHFAKYLVNCGHEVIVFTPSYNVSLPKQEELDGIKVQRLEPWFKYGQAAFIPQLVFKLKNFDIIHLHFPFIGGVEFLFLKFFIARQTKLILHYHMDLVGVGAIKFIFMSYKLKILPWLVWLSDRVIVTSRDYFLHSFLFKILRKKNKLIIIPNGIDYNFFSARKDEDSASDLIGGRKPTILFVGGLDRAHYFKGVEILLRAWRQVMVNHEFTKASLVIVGDGDLRSYYETLAESLKIEKSVKFVGRVEDDELPDYYYSSVATVLPSIDKTEAFGLVLLESMAAGTPIIAADLPGVRTLVKNGKTGLLVKPGNQDDLAAKIIIMLATKKITWRENCSTLAKSYDWTVVGKQLESLMISLCA